MTSRESRDPPKRLCPHSLAALGGSKRRLKGPVPGCPRRTLPCPPAARHVLSHIYICAYKCTCNSASHATPDTYKYKHEHEHTHKYDHVHMQLGFICRSSHTYKYKYKSHAIGLHLSPQAQPKNTHTTHTHIMLVCIGLDQYPRRFYTRSTQTQLAGCCGRLALAAAV